jgi:hypothetical protein
MPAPKRTAAATPSVIQVSPAADPAFSEVNLTIFDGTRQPIAAATEILLSIRDGSQKQLYRAPFSGPAITIKLPVHNNFADNYSIVAWAKGYQQAGFQPVRVTSGARQALDLMLLKKQGDYHFAQAKWQQVIARKPLFAQIFAASTAAGTSDVSLAFNQLIESQPAQLACLLNITSALEQIFLANKTPLDYFKEFNLADLRPDRIFGYADARLIDQVRLAAQEGAFSIEPPADLALHGDATASFRDQQFGEANIQLTFHEKNRKSIGGVDCIYVEPDIDYYKDTAAHIFLEVIPHAFTGNVTSPRAVYVLRWMASRRVGVPEFNPLYTIE